MGIKTRESLRDIKTFDRAKNLAEKSRNGLSDLNHEASDTQGGGYSSESEYAGDSLQGYERSAARTAVFGAERLGRWGMKRTAKNIRKWRNRPVKVDEPAPKQLPPPKRPALNAPKTAEKSAKTAEKTAEKTAKTAKKTAEASAKAAKKAAEAAKKAAEETVKAAKAAAKAVVTAVKAVVAAIKDIVAAIAAGGWVAVLIICIICMVALVAGSIYAIFVPSANDLSLFTVMSECEWEQAEQVDNIKNSVAYDYCSVQGEDADWVDVIAVYAAKLNLNADEPEDVATFDEKKAGKLKQIWRDMNAVSGYTQTQTKTVPQITQDEDGNPITVDVEITEVYLYIVKEPMTAYEIAEQYGFSKKQYKALDELLDSQNADLWRELLGERR